MAKRSRMMNELKESSKKKLAEFAVPTKDKYIAFLKLAIIEVSY